MEAIELKNIAFSYGKELILKDLSASFRRGEMAVVLGRNGSGKSTLFNILTGIQRDYSGVLHINGHDIKRLRKGSKDMLRIGFMNQFHQTTFPFSVFDVVLTGRASFSKFGPSKGDRERVEAVLESFDLLRYKDKPYTELSGGERQLVLLCRVLVQDPDIILLDEPTNHLDLHYQIAVLDNLKKLVHKDKTVICIMHDPNLAFQYGDRFFVMGGGKLKSLDGMSKAAIHQVLEEAYHVDLSSAVIDDKMVLIPKSKLWV
ncbi:ABC transporter ATP-binding protein [Sphingobacterium deserti]|uniref:Iron ABC transporter ATP-binding protein n=1 Tax=Sphingobacterium deserti TaxID=1229276 RepID=A0A0B8T103_9SPHI|nr:ABC transporter ATP-binding protein [Sphingobacterium deserti]KGE12303.1 iron ABC transporter ATP-binding protein [Sphingobacterium deserti]